MTTTFFDAFTSYGLRKGMHAAQPYKLEQVVHEMRHCSISAALVTSSTVTLYDAMHENLKLTAELKPYDFLFPLWNVMPHWTDEFPEPTKLISLMAQHNVRAVRLNPKTNAWSLQSKSSRPLLEELQRTRTPVFIDHTTQECEWHDLEFLAEQFPALPVVNHGIRWDKQRLMIPLLLYNKSMHLTFDGMQANELMEWLVAHGCEDQLLFASNAPSMAMGAHRCYVDYADVSESVRTKIASGNLIRLLKGLAPPRVIENKNEDQYMAASRAGKPQPGTVIDCHAHILDEGLNGGGEAYVMFNGGPRGVTKLAKRMGIDEMGLMSWNGTVGAQAQDGNRATRAALDAAPKGWWGLGTFDVVHESAETLRQQMEALYADKRFLGLKPYPSYGVPYDDARYDVWWKFGNERKLYCLIHPVKWFQKDEFESLCSRFPDLTVVAAHCGSSYGVADTAIALAKKFPNFYAEITLTPVGLGVIDYLVKGCGADRVLYGSDLPMRDPRPQMGWVVFSEISAQDKAKVLGANAKAMLDRIRAANGSAV